jgi:hypothetical protein
MIKNCEGLCAKCGSYDVDFYTAISQDNQISYPYSCKNCGHQGKEWYELTYIESE